MLLANPLHLPALCLPHRLGNAVFNVRELQFSLYPVRIPTLGKQMVGLLTLWDIVGRLPHLQRPKI